MNNLSREKRSKRKVKKFYYIAVEGEITEPIYFSEFSSHFELDNKKIKLEILASKDGKSSPQHCFNRLEKRINERKPYKKDEIWLVIDRDPQA